MAVGRTSQGYEGVLEPLTVTADKIPTKDACEWACVEARGSFPVVGILFLPVCFQSGQ